MATSICDVKVRSSQNNSFIMTQSLTPSTLSSSNDVTNRCQDVLSSASVRDSCIRALLAQHLTKGKLD